MTSTKRAISNAKDIPSAKRPKSNYPSDRKNIGFGRAPVPDDAMEQFTAPSLGLSGYSLLTFVNVTAAKLFDAVRVNIFG